jgi:hypothetical protein
MIRMATAATTDRHTAVTPAPAALNTPLTHVAPLNNTLRRTSACEIWNPRIVLTTAAFVTAPTEACAGLGMSAGCPEGQKGRTILMHNSLRQSPMRWRRVQDSAPAHSSPSSTPSTSCNPNHQSAALVVTEPITGTAQYSRSTFRWKPEVHIMCTSSCQHPHPPACYLGPSHFQQRSKLWCGPMTNTPPAKTS